MGWVNTGAMVIALLALAAMMYRTTMCVQHQVGMWLMLGGMALMLWLMGTHMGMPGAVSMWAMIAGMVPMVWSERGFEIALEETPYSRD